GRMRLAGPPLPQAEIDLVDAWIDAGAPRTGLVAAAPCLPEPEYVPTTPTPPPPGGYQLVLDGPTLAPGEELEGCLWMPVPNPTDLAVGKWEFFLNPGTPEHIALTITDFNDMFTISVPPFTQKVQPGRFTNDGSTPMYVLSLGGHMHKRGLRFTAWWSDGAKAYENFDWSHPVSRPFEPPVVLAPGDHIDFECLHDNGVTRPVKRDGSGNPTTLTFGLTTDDEMCVLVGTYY